jgi:hypothetical protein
VFIATGSDRGYQTDFWHHLARGREIVQSGRLVDVDLFTCTVPGAPLRDANWLSQVLYYGLHQAGGLPLVQFVNSLALAAAVGLLVWVCRRASGSLGAAAAAASFTFLGLWQQVLLIRPQTFSVLLFVTLFAVLDAAARRPRLLLLVPPLMALWANLHGGFPIGLVLIGAFVVAALWERAARRLARETTPHRQSSPAAFLSATRIPQSAIYFAFAAAVLATFVNPYGWGVYRYVFTLSSAAAGRGVEEWLPPGLNTWVGKTFAASVGLLLVLFASARRRRPGVRDVCLAVCFLPLACSSVRMVAWWLLATAPCVASLGKDVWGRISRLRLRTAPLDGTAKPQAAFPTHTPSAASITVFASLALVAFISLPWFEHFNPLLQSLRTTRRTESDLHAAAEHIRAAAPSSDTPGGAIFSRLEWGEYLAWSAGPARRVFMDGRIEIYPDSVWSQYAAVTAGRADWQEILDGYDVAWLLLDLDYHADLLPQVRRSPRWRPVLQSGPAVLFALQPLSSVEPSFAGTDSSDP